MSEKEEPPPPTSGEGETALVKAPSKELATVPARLPDKYEARYMAGLGRVLHRDKHMMPWPIQAIILAPGLIAAAGAFAAGLWYVGLGVLPVFLLLWILFVSLRVTVSEGAVNVQYGLFGPTIPTASITAAEATTYDWKRYGGYGIRRAKGEWLYNMPGDEGRAVRIHWRDSKGKERTHLIGTPNPDQMMAAIDEARKLLPGEVGEVPALPDTEAVARLGDGSEP
jgi:hypothetical protein